MATLCTELGMPKYRENKKKWKRFLPGNIPANICRTQCLVRVWRCLRALQCAPPTSMAARPLLDVEGCIFACASVYTIRKRACLCDSFWLLQACASTRGCFFFMYIQSLLSSFPAHFSPLSLMRMRPCAKYFLRIHPSLPHPARTCRCEWICLRACASACTPATCHYDEQWQL